MKKGIRLAFLADGTSVHTKRWLTCFSEMGYDVHLLTFTPEFVPGVHIHKLGYFGKGRYPLRIWSIRRTIDQVNPDILHAHYVSNYGVYAALSGFRPLVLSVWGDDIAVDPERSMARKLSVEFALKRADVVHTSDKVGQGSLVELGCDPRKIFVQEWWVDTSVFSPDARSTDLRRALGIDNSYSVLCARWWRPEYSVDVFIRAMPMVLSELPNIKFILLGGGVLENSLKELAKSLGVYENVAFIGGIPESQMPAYLASVDVYVDTVARVKGVGGMGQTTREVMACGTPQILGDLVGVRGGGWFRGVMYQQSNHQDLAEKIINVLKDEKLRMRIREESRNYILQCCSRERVLSRLDLLYTTLCAGVRK